MLPDPDSEAMGQLVDQWLVSLRNAGWTGRQLQTAAEALGSVMRAERPGTPEEEELVKRFTDWWQQHSSN